MASFKDHFSTAANEYLHYRPRYPRELASALANACQATDTALDCGCGNGQFSVLLAEYFQQVFATDASNEQIANAMPKSNITYYQALAESSGLPDASVDLITVAQAAHWLDLPRFYEEVRRIAKPDALIALISYGPTLADGAIGDVINHFYHDIISPYWPPERRHVETHYQELPFPFTEVPLADIPMQAQWTRDQLIGYISTWSAVKKAREVLATDPVNILKENLMTHWPNEKEKNTFHWQLTVRLGRING